MKTTIFVILMPLIALGDGNLTFKLAHSKGGKICPLGGDKQLELTSAVLATGKDILSAEMIPIHEDRTNMRLEKRVFRNGSDKSELVQVTTEGEVEGGPVIDDFFVLNFTFTPAGAEKFRTVYKKNRGKWISIVFNGKSLESSCIGSSDIMVPPAPPIMQLTLGSDKIKNERLFKVIKENILK